MCEEIVTVGLDLSLTGTGYCVKRGVCMTVGTIKTQPKDFANDLDRLKYITEKVMAQIPKDVKMICIEDFFTPANRTQTGAAIKIAMLGTLVRVAIYDAGYPFFIPVNSQIKKFVTGKGTSQKNIVVREVYKRWGIDAKDDNQADACGMAHLAEALVEAPEVVKERPQYQVKVVGKILEDRPRYNVNKEKVNG